MENEEEDIKEWIKKKIEEYESKRDESKEKEVMESKKERKYSIKQFLIISCILLLISISIISIYLIPMKMGNKPDPIFLRIHKGEYNSSTVKINGTLVSFRISSSTGKGMGYIENEGYIIEIMNLTNIDYSIGDVIETNSTIVRNNFVTLESVEDRKIGRTKLIPKYKVEIEDVNKHPEKYEWQLIEIRDAAVERVNVTQVLPPIYDQEEHYMLVIKLRDLKFDAFYLGPKITLKTNRKYNFLASVLRPTNTYVVRIFQLLE